MAAFDPDKYMEDSKGHLIPVEKIKPIDLARHGLVTETIAEWIEIQERMRVFKRQLMGDIHAFVEMSAEQYDAKIGGARGNVTLMSFDGRFKLLVAISDSITFDEQIQAAKALIDECAAAWTENSSSEVKAIINHAFQVDKEGNISTGRIFALRRLAITDPRWLKAMEAISNSVQVVGSKSYVRAYERDDNGRFNVIPLDLAAL